MGGGKLGLVPRPPRRPWGSCLDGPDGASLCSSGVMGSALPSLSLRGFVCCDQWPPHSVPRSIRVPSPLASLLLVGQHAGPQTAEMTSLTANSQPRLASTQWPPTQDDFQPPDAPVCARIQRERLNIARYGVVRVHHQDASRSRGRVHAPSRCPRHLVPAAA